MNDALPLPVGVACIPIREEDVIQLMDRFTELQGSKVEGIYLLPDETITLYKIIDFAAQCMVSEESESYKSELIAHFDLEQKDLVAHLDGFYQFAEGLIQLVNDEFSDNPLYAELFATES